MKSNSKFYIEQGAYKWDDKSFLQDRVVKLFAELYALLEKKEGLKILDVGSGTGDFIYRVSKKYPENDYYGNDIADNVVKMNKDEKKKITWTVEDFNGKTSYKDNFFDIVIAGEVIEHLYDTDGFLIEIKRILKKKGLLFITTPNLASWLDRFTLLFGMQPFSTEVSNKSRTFGREKFYSLLGLSDEESESAGHLRCFTKGSLRALLRYYKFDEVKDIPCHVHDILPNRIITKFFSGMSQNLFFIVQNK